MSPDPSLLAFLAANHFATGETPQRTGNDHAIVAPYGMFRTRNGEVALAPSQEQSYQRLLDALGLPQLREDPRFATNDLRVKNRVAVNAAIEARLQAETTEYWIDKLNAAGVPCGRVMGLAEVFADPQVLDQETMLSQQQPGHGTVRMLGFPIKFTEAPAACAVPRPNSVPIPTRSYDSSAMAPAKSLACAPPARCDDNRRPGA